MYQRPTNVLSVMKKLTGDWEDLNTFKARASKVAYLHWKKEFTNDGNINLGQFIFNTSIKTRHGKLVFDAQRDLSKNYRPNEQKSKRRRQERSKTNSQDKPTHKQQRNDGVFGKSL